ncbi:hypothetical protein QQ008_00970 [Fulvivirgaceae bacterium BMA10]|uniref:Uncharacterized protein n=1 Tax=Splendidivirga corallicola TaxID=3051826 RepID=A0ABT8KGR1_9BACT|nr:hypothetical protein [Fulvivirgaceae bacterium BMA10]
MKKISNIAIYLSFLCFQFNSEILAQENQFSRIEIDSIPNELNYSGVPIESIKWYDEDGLHYLIISKREVGDFFTPSWKSTIYASMYLKVRDSYKLIWRIKDFSLNPYTKVQYFNNSIKLNDIDGDGALETSFIYGIVPDGLDPIILKLMLHTKGEKLAIRGILPQNKEDADRYSRDVDIIFSDFPEKFKIYATDRWDKFVDSYKLEYW